MTSDINIDFIEKQRSLIAKIKIIEISKNLKEMDLLFHPINDFDKFVSLQNHSINTKFNGQRTRKREQKIFIFELWSKLLLAFKNLSGTFQPDLKMKNELSCY